MYESMAAARGSIGSDAAGVSKKAEQMWPAMTNQWWRKSTTLPGQTDPSNTEAMPPLRQPSLMTNLRLYIFNRCELEDGVGNMVTLVHCLSVIYYSYALVLK